MLKLSCAGNKKEGAPGGVSSLFLLQEFQGFSIPGELDGRKLLGEKVSPFWRCVLVLCLLDVGGELCHETLHGSLVGVGKLQIGGKKLLAVQTKTILTGQLSHQIGRMLGEHFAAAMPQPFLIDIEFPADRT